MFFGFCESRTAFVKAKVVTSPKTVVFKSKSNSFVLFLIYVLCPSGQRRRLFRSAGNCLNSRFYFVKTFQK